MPRPKKCRRVCDYPLNLGFSPESSESGESVILTVDEYECLRLVDKEGLSQAECALRMDVARTTVQLIYASARRKLAEALVDGRPLRIEGGDYRLCGGEGAGASCRGCPRREIIKKGIINKGANIMRIAVTYENGQVFQHFGHTAQFKVYEATEGKVVSAQVVDTMGQGHGALAGVLNVLKVDVLICGGIGMGAQNALNAAGIRFYAGVSGEADKAVEAFLADELGYDPAPVCNHHGEHHHGEGHSCGSHGCGGGHNCH